MKVFLIAFIAGLIALNTTAQTNSEGVEDKIVKVNLLYPSFEREVKVNSVTTCGLRAGLNTFFEYGNSNSLPFYGTSVRTRYFEFIPTVEVYYRWYYRLLKRQRKEKKTINNSSAYLFGGAEIMTPGIKLKEQNRHGLDDIISGIYAGWGFRRTIGKNIIFDFNIRNAILIENANKIDFINVIPGLKIGYRIK